MDFKKIMATDRNGKPLTVGQRVRVIMGDSGRIYFGTVTEVCPGSSHFKNDNGVPCQRPNGDFEIIEISPKKEGVKTTPKDNVDMILLQDYRERLSVR